VNRASPLHPFYPLRSPLGRFEGLGEVPPRPLDLAVLKVDYQADIHAVFTLRGLYDHEAALARKFPNIRNIRANIRDVLQKLRDLGEIQILGHGVYRRMA
jgi:hypothetical protein